MKNSNINQYDIVISGAGSIGLVQALLLAKHDIKIAIIDPKPLEAITKVDDTRNIALMHHRLRCLNILEFSINFTRSLVH